MDKDKYFKMWESELWDVYSDEMDEIDFHDMAIGFFIAKGLTFDEAEEMYEYCVSKNKY